MAPHMLDQATCRLAIRSRRCLCPFTPQAGTVEQIHPVHALRMLDGEACRDPPTERIPHERHPWRAKRIEKPFQVKDMRADVSAFGCQRRSAETRQIKRIHCVLFVQAWQEEPPGFSRATQAMNQDDRGSTLSCTVVMDWGTTHLIGPFMSTSQQHPCTKHTGARFPRVTIHLCGQGCYTAGSYQCEKEREKMLC